MNLDGISSNNCWLNSLIALVFTEFVIEAVVKPYMVENENALFKLWERINIGSKSMSSRIGQFIFPLRFDVLTLPALKTYWVEVLIGCIIRNERNEMKTRKVVRSLNDNASMMVSSFSHNASMTQLAAIWNNAIETKLTLVEEDTHIKGGFNEIASEIQILFNIFPEVENIYSFESRIDFSLRIMQIYFSKG